MRYLQGKGGVPEVQVLNTHRPEFRDPEHVMAHPWTSVFSSVK